MCVALRISVFLFMVLFISTCYSATIPRNFDSRLNDDIIIPPKKRPFCNAFTGCGRKRSQNPPGMPLQEIMRQRQMDEDMAYADTDNAIEELTRQILSEAKLWEAIQEASAEIARRKQNALQ
ncbi:cardioactive peptide [Colias croceus]|uniref:cardioactive peptide n=1 Tax=Colias crocea TaxID=72248 RepID=UPI001E27EB4C|nr:cardioactive peptide [Colias croceus]